VAIQKNQHYVPRCALKPFTLGGEGLAINLFNIDAARTIQNAPVKNQCSKDYFYGKDLRAENALANLEGHYTRIAASLMDERDLSAEDEDWLRLFVVVQTRRTESAIRDIEKVSTGVMDEVFKAHASQRPADLSHQQLVAHSMTSSLKLHDYCRDLKFVLLRNRTCVELITSDHPAIVTNRFSFEKLNDGSFGMSNSGIIMLFPICPTLIAMFFDIGVYTVSIPAGTRFVDLLSNDDIEALNALQHLHAHKNLYFSSWKDGGAISRQAETAQRARTRSKHKFTTLVRDKDAAGNVFRTVPDGQKAEAKEMIVAASFGHPRPTCWPAVLKYRPKRITFSNGSAIGHVRKEEWLRRR
jgi:hypothetical protein